MWTFQGSAILPFLFPIVVDVVNMLTREGVLSELLCADVLLLSEAIERVGNTFWKGARTFCEQGFDSFFTG